MTDPKPGEEPLAPNPSEPGVPDAPEPQIPAAPEPISPDLPPAPQPPAAPEPPAAPSYGTTPPPPPPAYGAAQTPSPSGSEPSYGAGATPPPAYGAGYGAQAYASAPAKPTPVYSLISLIAGIVGLLGGFAVIWIPIVGGILQLFIPAGAVVLGFIGRKREPQAKAMWLTGLILGFIGLALGLLSIVFWAVLFASVGNTSYVY